jgi:hypothetical protein
MRFALISLKAIHNNGVSARIPHQSAARTSLADSFSPGEAKAAYGGNRAINENLKSHTTIQRHGGCRGADFMGRIT